MIDLFHHSIKVILANQAPTGAYIALPNFPSALRASNTT
jgi:hypothetical protein